MVGTKLQYKIIIYYEDFKCVKRPWAKFYTVRYIIVYLQFEERYSRVE